MRKPELLAGLVALGVVVATTVNTGPQIGETVARQDVAAVAPSSENRDVVRTPAITSMPIEVEDNVAPAITPAAQPAEVPAAAITPAAEGKMSPSVAKLARAGGDNMVSIIVSYADFPQLADGERLDALGAEIVRSYSALNMHAVRIPASRLGELAVAASISRLSLDAPVKASSYAARQTAKEPGLVGGLAFPVDPNLGVAVLDSGVSLHPDIRLASSVNFVTTDKYCRTAFRTLSPQLTLHKLQPVDDTTLETAVTGCDPFGHGTHVAGIVSGNGYSSNDSYRGVAAGANIHSVRVLDADGRGVTSDVIAGLDWVLKNAARENVRVVNLSLGKAVEVQAADDPDRKSVV